MTKACIFAIMFALLGGLSFAGQAAPIDRHSLVTRHDVVLTEFDTHNPLSVGNGGFCFTVDATGLQTFSDSFEKTTPLGTLSDWGWHTFPNPNHWSLDTLHFKEFPELNGRMIPYADLPGNKMTPQARWLRGNPHRLDLGQIGFVFKYANGSPVTANNLTDIRQKLDLWDGKIISHFKFDGEPVEVETVCNPNLDAVAVHVVSPLVKQGRLAIQVHFPYGTDDMKTMDWDHPKAHATALHQPDSSHADIYRKVDQDTYYAAARWTDGATLVNVAKHQFKIGFNTPQTNAAEELEFVCIFSPTNLLAKNLQPFAVIKFAAQKYWNHFWQTGGAIDLSGSKDPRWFELERRIVLSQYLTAIQDAGEHPPQETGLTCNSWAGKFHLEMHLWHAAHFALWNRLPLLEKSLGWYQTILPVAEATARMQGYAGARWPKMTGPGGTESPSTIGPFLIWQEPHPIFFAELCYRAHPDRATLDQFRDIVFQTADFMASYATWDTNTSCYVLGPVLQCAQEIFPKNQTLNPTFELTYWRWGLETAQAWRKRLGLPRNPKWDDVLHQLAPLPVSDNMYLFTETTRDSYTNPQWHRDHPAVLAALGFVPGYGVNHDTMQHTLDWIWKNWSWPDTWGWDYPLMAMTAARLGEPERAVDALLFDTPKNHYGLNGHVYQSSGLTIYLPANGGLLYAVALMVAGWDGAPHRNAPGFPNNGQWMVRWENLSVAP